MPLTQYTLLYKLSPKTIALTPQTYLIHGQPQIGCGDMVGLQG